MIIFRKGSEIKKYLADKRESGFQVGFIPTMGALHDGHISLVRQAKAQQKLTVCSIFLNPTQFNNPSDLVNYPRSNDADIELLLAADCDVLFLPDTAEVYPDGFDKVRSYDFGYLETILEGAMRPGHFRGVGQVVGRLLEIIQPGDLYMGQKDYQQCKIIAELLNIMSVSPDESFNASNVNLHICPTVREPDGLAMSSRNRRLTESQRKIAGCLYQCLVSIQAKKDIARFETVKKECIELLADKGITAEYIALADAHDLRLLDNYDTEVPMVTLIAAKIGEIRLIDNMFM